MKRAAIAAAFLLFFSWLQVRAGSRGAVFAYRGSADGEGLLTPMLPPTVGVRLKSGPREINSREVLVCKQGQEKTEVIADSEKATVVEFVLTCDKRVFLIKGLYFEEGK